MPKVGKKSARDQVAKPAAPKSTRAPRGAYASDSMLARRERMLSVAQQMIADRGPEAFTIRELSQRAKVSVATIYASYVDKENLIAAAIVDYFQKLPVARLPPPTTLAEVLVANDQARAAIMQNKAYARQYTRLYFSGTADPRVYAAVRATVDACGTLHWLEQVSQRGDLMPGISWDLIAAMLATSRMGIMHDWVQGRLDDAGLSAAMPLTLLIFARSVTCGPTQAEVEAEINRRLAKDRP